MIWLPSRLDWLNDRHRDGPARPTKITLANMRDMGVRGLLIYCADHQADPTFLMSAF